MKITLPNNVTIEGTPDQVRTIATSLGYASALGNDGIHYLSESKGLIRIAEMDTRHIKNAALKLYREWVASLSSTQDTKTLLDALRNGPRNNITLLALIAEMRNRV